MVSKIFISIYTSFSLSSLSIAWVMRASSVSIKSRVEFYRAAIRYISVSMGKFKYSCLPCNRQTRKSSRSGNFQDKFGLIFLLFFRSRDASVQLVAEWTKLTRTELLLLAVAIHIMCSIHLSIIWHHLIHLSSSRPLLGPKSRPWQIANA